MLARTAAQRDGEVQAGFSLIEILVALGILAIIVLGIIGLFTHSMAVNASGFDYAKLASVGRRVLENMQSRNFLDPDLAATNSATWSDGVPDGMQVVYSIQDFAVSNWSQIQWTPGSGTPPVWPAPTATMEANLKRITIRVRSTRGNIRGRREFVVTSIKVPSGEGPGATAGGGSGGGSTGGGGGSSGGGP